MGKDLKRTPLYSWHREHGGHMIEFAGWEMPVAYPRGILEEHLRTRKFGGLFDISHMGRFLIRGIDAVPFMQHVLTNNVRALDPGVAQYTLIQNEEGGSIDDAYVYRLEEAYPSLETTISLLSMRQTRRKIGIGFSIIRDGTRMW